jgi:hypothetical protein
MNHEEDPPAYLTLKDPSLPSGFGYSIGLHCDAGFSVDAPGGKSQPQKQREAA